MKKYTKPTVNVISLKSSNDIAASFKNIQDQYINNYLKNNVTYALTQYAVTGSMLPSA